MKQSGLQFTEKQLLRIVEGLGAKGCWKQALSVVEWLYGDKERRLYKSRSFSFALQSSLMANTNYANCYDIE